MKIIGKFDRRYYETVVEKVRKYALRPDTPDYERKSHIDNSDALLKAIKNGNPVKIKDAYSKLYSQCPEDVKRSFYQINSGSLEQRIEVTQDTFSIDRSKLTQDNMMTNHTINRGRKNANGKYTRYSR